MRIHANPGHPAFHPEINARARVLFNGAPVPGQVISADEAAGEVIRLTGTVLNGRFVTETMLGRVQICLPDDLGHLRYSFMPNPRV